MNGAPVIDFWFDFISPFGYLASLRIDALAARHGAVVRWHPLLIGVTVLKVMGLKPVLDTPLKGDYALRELARYTRRHGVVLARDLRAPPMNPLPAARAFAWLHHHANEQARPFAQAVYDDHWRRGLAMDEAPRLLEAGQRAGVPPALMAQAVSAADAAPLLRDAVAQAMALGVFGSPFFRVGDEPFFGVDKLELVDDWLAAGGW
jgi:2-hydroxychromene-2-carboxylate isomerase